MAIASGYSEREKTVLDIGGEGRHPEAWNLNPSQVKTLGPHRGKPIPRHISGRAEEIPFYDRSVDRIFVERTPLRIAALKEIARIIAPTGTIILRHTLLPNGNPHALAKQIIRGRTSRRLIRLGGQVVQETKFLPPRLSSSQTEKVNHTVHDHHCADTDKRANAESVSE